MRPRDLEEALGIAQRYATRAWLAEHDISKSLTERTYALSNVAWAAYDLAREVYISSQNDEQECIPLAIQTIETCNQVVRAFAYHVGLTALPATTEDLAA